MMPQCLNLCAHVLGFRMLKIHRFWISIIHKVSNNMYDVDLHLLYWRMSPPISADAY
jgi:hypothetical protein